ncbi:manganese efflux pump MntP, partial [Campylobacter sp.]|uniref:manganese efflux pump MntP n=1 Tax=Campylobacter sp. TaxID=205 RepID=UPI0026FCED8C|nr:manganese efflux pump MntP family protein [Campylobacter sp.]
MELLLLAFALAMDSVALSIANGAKCRTLNLSDIFKVSFVFGFFQALMPFLGYLLGLAFVNFIASVDHFIAFGILGFLGVKMIMEAREQSSESCLNELGLKTLMFGAIATSIDALAVGVMLSFEDTRIAYACLTIGVVCFVMCIIACYIGKFMGLFLEKKALILGGVILIALG